ncbi:MAG: acyl-CoA/acyl-ACP dehydrogenase [Burkholderiales bacterium]|nr:acyl-CoA/acyl-ACP dehydrogenase [Burkholderiales bacterium]
MSERHEDIHADLAAAVRSFAAREGGVARVRAMRESDAGYDRALWPRIGALGWLGLLVPEARGGAGLGIAEASVVARELGRALVPEPVIACGVLALPLLLHTQSQAGEQLLSRCLQGEAVAALAWQETGGNIDPSCLDSAIGEAGGKRVLNGVKRFVAFGRHADGYVVSARASGGIGLYWVERSARGLAYRSLRRADGSEHGELSFDRVELAPESMLAAPGEGERALAAALDAGVIALSAELLGVAERALEITLDYLRTRVQFGKPIGAFQALQHRCVDLYLAKELGVSALTAALGAWDQAEPARRAALASRVKVRCATAALAICREAIQMHGAMGFTDACDVGLYLKRALTLSAWLGNATAHRRRYGRLALARYGVVPGSLGSLGRAA